jgi:putative ABC transport system substrate-binding protein
MRRREFLLLLATNMMAARAVRAQQKAMPVIGFLNSGLPDTDLSFLAAFRQGLGDAGFMEGKNVAIDPRWAEGRYDRLPVLVGDLVSRKVDVIAAGGDAAVIAAKDATSTIPIVFFNGGDPLAMGLIASLAHPGGNLTGFSTFAAALLPKRLELLSELAPQTRVIAMLVNPSDPNAERFINAMEQAASAKGIKLQILKAGTEDEIDDAFASLVQLRTDGLIVSPNAFFVSRREQLVVLASRYAIPAIYPRRQFATAGGLISYGSSLTAVYRRMGIYVGKILNGAKPADLPVQQPSIFQLVVNLKTAKELGLTVPPSILARADEVIE